MLSSRSNESISEAWIALWIHEWQAVECYYDRCKELWQWSEPEPRPVRYSNWTDNEPTGASECARLTYNGEAGWKDLRCYENFPFICKKSTNGELMMMPDCMA